MLMMKLPNSLKEQARVRYLCSFFSYPSLLLLNLPRTASVLVVAAATVAVDRVVESQLPDVIGVFAVTAVDSDSRKGCRSTAVNQRRKKEGRQGLFVTLCSYIITFIFERHHISHQCPPPPLSSFPYHVQ